MLGRRHADRNRRAAAGAVINLVAVDHRLHAQERQQLAIELARAFEIRCGERNMAMPLTSMAFPFQPPRGVGLRAMTLSSSIQEFG
jgi:hypothetical protein